MGQKLSIDQVKKLINKNPNTQMFDTCVKCGGTEEYMTMNGIEDSNDSFDVICDECKSIINISNISNIKMKTFITINGTKAIVQNFKDLAAARQSAIKTCDQNKEVLVREITDLKDYSKSEIIEQKAKDYVSKWYDTLTKEELIDGLGNTMYYESTKK